MNPLIVLSALFAAACAAPAPGNYAVGVAPGHYAAGPGLLASAPLLAAAPVQQHYIHEPAVISLPAPLIKTRKDPDTHSVHQPAPITSEQINYGQTTYVAGYNSRILKPAIPDFKIAVPTALRGSTTYNAPIVHTQKELHVREQPIPVQVPYDVPYDVIKNVERIVEVPTPYKVDRPYNVHVPTPYVGETIIKKTVGAPVIRNHHRNIVAAPAVSYSAGHAYGAAPVFAGHAYGAAPVLAGHAYGAAPAFAGHAYAAAPAQAVAHTY